MVVARTGREYLPLVSTEGAALEEIALMEIVTGNCSSKFVGDEMEREVVLKLGNYLYMRDSLKQFLSDMLGAKKALREMRHLI